WKKLEFKAYGMNFPTAGVRIKMLEEGIKVIKKLWTEERANFEGEYYQLKDAISYPKMVQEKPSIWVGTMEAKPKMLKLIGELAEGVNIAWAFSPEIFKERVARIKEARAKTDLPPLKISSGSWVKIVDEDQYDDMIKQRALSRKITVKEADKQMQGALVGTREQIFKKIVKYKEIGVTHFVFMFPHGEEEEYLGQFQGLLKKLG
ncbi:MAG: LLM class flavin-dependent oxidoreductase, partial [Candidatus Kariarchaeaceae archaeon]